MIKKTLAAFLSVAFIASMSLLPLPASANSEISTADEFHTAVQEIGALTSDKLSRVEELLNFAEQSSFSSEITDDVTTLNSYKEHIVSNNENGWYFTDDFDNYQPENKTYGWWECVNSDTIIDDFNTVVSKKKLATTDFVPYNNNEGIVAAAKTNNCLALSALPSTAETTISNKNNAKFIPSQIFALPETIVNGNGIQKAEFKYYWCGAAREYTLILSKTDNQHYTGVELATKDYGINKVTCDIDADTFRTKETLISKDDVNGHYYANWIDVTLEYITKDDGNYYRLTFLSPSLKGGTTDNTDGLTDVVEVKVDGPVSNFYITGNNVAYEGNNFAHYGIDDVKIAVTDKPIVEGATIRAGEGVAMADQQLKFNTDFSFAKQSLPENAENIEYGVLFASKSLSSLDLNTAGIKNVKFNAENKDDVDTDVSIYITDSTLNSGNSGKKCSVRAYIKYEVDGAETVVYSENNDSGKGITNGIQNKSLIGTVKSILLAYAPSGASDEKFAAAVESYNSEYKTSYSADDVWGVITSANATAAKNIIPDNAGFEAAPNYTYRFVMYTVLCLMQNQ